MTMNKKLIAPLVVLGAALVNQLTGYQLADSDINALINAAGIIAGVIAAFMNPKKQ